MNFLKLLNLRRNNFGVRAINNSKRCVRLLRTPLKQRNDQGEKDMALRGHQHTSHYTGPTYLTTAQPK